MSLMGLTGDNIKINADRSLTDTNIQNILKNNFKSGIGNISFASESQLSDSDWSQILHVGQIIKLKIEEKNLFNPTLHGGGSL